MKAEEIFIQALQNLFGLYKIKRVHMGDLMECFEQFKKDFAKQERQIVCPECGSTNIVRYQEDDYCQCINCEFDWYNNKHKQDESDEKVAI